MGICYVKGQITSLGRVCRAGDVDGGGHEFGASTEVKDLSVSHDRTGARATS